MRLPNILLVGLLWCFTARLLAGIPAPLVIDAKDLQNGIKLARHTAWLKDTDGTLDLPKLLLDPLAQDRFTPAQKDLSFGHTSANYWIQWQLHNPYDEPLSLVLAIDYFMLDRADIYTVDQGHVIRVQEGGDRLPYRARYMPSRGLTYRIDIPPQSTYQYFIHSQTTSSLVLPLVLWDRSGFERSTAADQTMFGLYFGVLIGIFLYNLFIYVSTGFSRSYGAYVLLMLASFCFYMAWTGVGPQYLWGDSQFFTQRAFPIFGCMLAVMLYTFQIFFLNLRTHMPRIARLYLGLIIYNFLMAFAVASVIPISIAQRIAVSSGGICAIFMLAISVRMLFKGNRQAVFFTVAWSVFLLFIAIGASISVGLLDLPMSVSIYGSQVGSALESILLAIGLADRINHLQKERIQQAQKIQEQWGQLEEASKKLRNINENLEHLVAEKTQEVRSLLDFIPHGVFSIDEDLCIAKEYSAHLPDLLATRDIAGRSFTELFLSRSTMSENEKDQLIQTLQSALGDDVIAFESNAAHLPEEISFTDYQQNAKILSLTWNVELNAKSQVKRILVTALDATQARALEVEIKRQQNELHLVKELIDCGPARFAQFVATIGPLLDENEGLAQQAQLDVNSIKMMFINAHTAKGAARTLGLSQLSNIIHEAEVHYTDILKHSVPIDAPLIRDHMTQVRSSYEHYRKLNHETLGRKDDRTKVNIDKQFLVDHCRMMYRLPLNTEIRSSLDHIVKLIYNSLSFIIEDCFSQVNRIARDLDKPAPELKLQLTDTLVPQQVEEVLRKISVHLIRNALDHGIESSEERIKAGKAPVGVVSVRCQPHDTSLEIEVTDDGRGLNMGKLREKGQRFGFLQTNPSVQQIADTIFENGISTAEHATDISGRGVGMNAIRRFIQEANGSIEIAVGEALDATGNFRAFSLRIHLPLLALTLDRAS